MPSNSAWGKRGFDMRPEPSFWDAAPSRNANWENFMRRLALITAAIMSGALATNACTTDPYTGQQTINRTAVGIGVGALGG
jgi:hypothetical protein